MKKITLFLIGLILIGIPSYADTRASILLLHNGQGSSFEDDQLQDAVNQAVTGDTICLSEGSYEINEPLIIDKIISIIGTGQTTKLRGSINICIDGTPQVTGYMLNGMRISGDIIVQKELNGLKMKKIWIGGYFYSTADVKDVEIDKSYIKGFVPTQYVKSAVVTNCIIYYHGAYNSGQVCNSVGNDLLFVNCNIASVHCNSFQNIQDVTFLNSIIANYSAGASSVGVGNVSIGNNTFINCLCKTALTSQYGDVVEECYTESALATSTDSYNDMFPIFTVSKAEITAQFLQEKNYLGTDGSIVGAYGGSTPYTLEADGIHIKERMLKVDPLTRQLNVTLKVE